jgi:hypothetical protein
MNNNEKIKVIQQRIDLLKISISHLKYTDPEDIEYFETFTESKKQEIYQFIRDQNLKIAALEVELKLYK